MRCPATTHALADYVVRLTGISLAPATIDQVIGTIRSRHADAGCPGQPGTRETLKLVRAYMASELGYLVECVEEKTPH